MKLLLPLLTLLFIFSCNNAQEKPPETDIATLPEIVVPTGHEPSESIGPEYSVADVKKIFTVSIKALNYSAKEQEKLDKASLEIARIVNSDEYKLEVLNSTFTNNLGLSNEGIYHKLFAGAEALIPAVNYQMDLTVKSYYGYNSTVGYTYANVMIVHTNQKFHNKYTHCEVASNLFHEWTHKMGFAHSSAKDSGSIPYAHNRIIRKLCR